jgi:hypothetical protein
MEGGSVGTQIFKALVESIAENVCPNPDTGPDNHIENRCDLCIVIVGLVETKPAAIESVQLER